MFVPTPSRTLKVDIEDGLEVPEWGLAIRTITPEIAREMLTVKVVNRPISRLWVSRYANDMEDKRWKLTPESVILDSNGGVLDGQHRLQAVVDTGISRPFMVVSGVNPELIDVLGIGRMRSASDIIGMMNIDRAVAPAASVLFRYLDIPDRLSWRGDNVRPVPATVITELALEHPGLANCVSLGRSIANQLSASRATITVAVYLTSLEVPIAHQQEWLDRVQHGDGLDSNSPILVFRNTMRSPRAANVKHSSSRQRFELALYLKAWQMWRDGKTVSARRMREPEQMPEVGLPTRPTTLEQIKHSGAVNSSRTPASSGEQTPVPRDVRPIGSHPKKRRLLDGPRVRAWAETQGYSIPGRGRLPEAIKQAYTEAHPEVYDSSDDVLDGLDPTDREVIQTLIREARTRDRSADETSVRSEPEDMRTA